MTTCGALCANDVKFEMISFLKQRSVRHWEDDDEKNGHGLVAGLNVYGNVSSRVVLHEKEEHKNGENK